MDKHPSVNAANDLRYYKTVFLTPPWPEIYKHDKERKQSFDEAVRTYETMQSVYTAFGYELMQIPRLPVNERAMFLIRTITGLVS